MENQNQFMKTKIQKILIVIITCICAAQSARCQTSANGLAVSAEASLSPDTNAPQLFITIHLLNTTNRDLVVLTKKLNFDFDVDASPWTFNIGYNDSGVTYQGHLIVPSVSDFSPVTIKPNEEAFITQLVTKKCCRSL
jgi:hypothetical protein